MPLSQYVFIISQSKDLFVTSTALGQAELSTSSSSSSSCGHHPPQEPPAAATNAHKNIPPPILQPLLLHTYNKTVVDPKEDCIN
jgi:hypothetical protein